jgi:hypothetical protein
MQLRSILSKHAKRINNKLIAAKSSDALVIDMKLK